jgi:hypothetical protein
MSTFSGGKRTIYAVNGSGGAAVQIPATAGSRKVTIQECAPGGGSFTGGNYAPQGLNYTRPDDNFTAVFPLLPSATLVLQNTTAQGIGAGAFQGGPAQTDPAGRSIAARIHCTLISATATATQVLVIEEA